MIKVLQPGFYSTIQDLGRLGYHEYGVPVSGAMDQYSAKFANALLNNSQNDAVMEITMTGPQLEFQKATQICISGANMSPTLNDNAIKMNTLIDVNSGDTLSFGRLLTGFRSYLAVSGGFQSELKLNSRSMFKHITSNFRIEKGDELSVFEMQQTESIKNAILKFDEKRINLNIIEVFKGPEFEFLTPNQQELLLNVEYTISNLNNRMAYQLEEVFTNSLKSIITSLVLPGTIQLTPSGQLIILMRDCQTTGGYPRILQLKETSINSLAQKCRGQKIQFKLIY
jgi:biotin-dependent carboxylase-like uncharacterized protein